MLHCPCILVWIAVSWYTISLLSLYSQFIEITHTHTHMHTRTHMHVCVGGGGGGGGEREKSVSHFFMSVSSKVILVKMCVRERAQVCPHACVSLILP